MNIRDVEVATLTKSDSGCQIFIGQSGKEYTLRGPSVDKTLKAGIKGFIYATGKYGAFYFRPSFPQGWCKVCSGVGFHGNKNVICPNCKGQCYGSFEKDKE